MMHKGVIPERSERRFDAAWADLMGVLRSMKENESDFEKAIRQMVSEPEKAKT